MGFWQAYSTATGLVVAGTTMVSLGYSMGLVGPAFIVSAFIAMIVSILVAFSYAELSSILPGAGMIGDYTMAAMGRFMAIVAVLGGYIVLVSAAGAMESITAGLAAEMLTPQIDSTLFAIALVVLFCVVNLLGVDIFASTQVVLTLTMMIVTALLGAAGLLGIGTEVAPHAVAFNPAGWGTVFQSLALGIWLYIGIEYVCPMAEEVKNPSRNIPRAMIFGLLTIFVADMLFGQAITRYVDLGALVGSTTPQVDGATAMFGQFGKVLIILVTILASASSINSHLAAVPRMLYGLAREGLLPKIFTYIHPRTRTPWTGIIAVFLLLCIPFLLSISMDLIATLILASCVTWLISYIIAQINVIILRKKYPNMERPFKTPFYPLPQILGLIATIYMIVTIHPEAAMKIKIYSISGAFLAGIVIYAVIWLKYKKMPLFTPLSLEQIRGDISKHSESAPISDSSSNGVKIG
jgi:amino acid transporter